MIKQTIYLSLIVQIITFFIGLLPYFIKIKPEYIILRDILSLEVIVQFIELVFYMWFAFSAYDLSKQDIAKYRYYDWFLTTPTMLISIAMFFIYMKSKNITREIKEKKTENNEPLKFKDVLQENKESFIKLIKYNAIMLLFGYLNEINITSLITKSKQNQIISNNIFIVLGFIAFCLVFHELYKHIGDIEINKLLFWTMFGLWFIYGIAALFQNVAKNTMYNILDMFSKNFYGLFIAFYVVYINYYY